MRHIIKIKVSAKKKTLNKSKNKQTNNRKKQTNKQKCCYKNQTFFCLPSQEDFELYWDCFPLNLYYTKNNTS